MSIRLIEIDRVLKPTGSVYLHCDPTAGHYLKILMDAVLAPPTSAAKLSGAGRVPITRRSGGLPFTMSSLSTQRAMNIHGITPRCPYMLGHIRDNFVQREDGKYKTDYYGNVLTGSGTRRGESGKPWRGFDPTAKGRHWAVPGKIWEKAGIDPEGLTQHQKLVLLLKKASSL